jgi:hypothetical protein
MLNKRLSSVECDACGVTNDGDPVSIVEQLASVPSHFSPEKRDMVAYFWLCGQCSVEYPEGIKGFFRTDFWDEVYFCAKCNEDEVDEPNHWCDYCIDSNPPEDE